MSATYPEIYIQFLATVLVAFLLIGSIITILLSYQKKKILQEKKLELIHADYEKSLLKTQLEIQEEVHKRISMEIHDNIGQVLLLANINNTILQSMPLPENSQVLIAETKQLLSKAMEDMTAFSRSLHSKRVTDIGVFNLIRQELEHMEFKGLFKVDTESYSLADNEIMISPEAQLIVYRMFQEITKNILKHSDADLIRLSGHDNEKEAELTIADNGKGFSLPLSPEAGQGVGIRSLRDRIQMVGGRILIDSTLQKGTSVTIFIPHSQS